jgi:hypothetical protein
VRRSSLLIHGIFINRNDQFIHYTDRKIMAA